MMDLLVWIFIIRHFKVL